FDEDGFSVRDGVALGSGAAGAYAGAKTFGAIGLAIGGPPGAAVGIGFGSVVGATLGEDYGEFLFDDISNTTVSLGSKGRKTRRDWNSFSENEKELDQFVQSETNGSTGAYLDEEGRPQPYSYVDNALGDNVRGDKYAYDYTKDLGKNYRDWANDVTINELGQTSPRPVGRDDVAKLVDQEEEGFWGSVKSIFTGGELKKPETPEAGGNQDTSSAPTSSPRPKARPDDLTTPTESAPSKGIFGGLFGDGGGRDAGKPVLLDLDGDGTELTFAAFERAAAFRGWCDQRLRGLFARIGGRHVHNRKRGTYLLRRRWRRADA
ncbi:MAG: hypothetical protein AAF742_02570, partial [Pseudomonadota bacterium]